MTMQKARFLKTAAALATAFAIAATAIVPAAIAAPIGSRAAQLSTAASNPIVDVQWRRGRWIGPAIAGAIIGGAIIGATRDREGYYEDEGPPPGYYNDRRGPRQCWVETGPNGNTGYWRAC